MTAERCLNIPYCKWKRMLQRKHKHTFWTGSVHINQKKSLMIIKVLFVFWGRKFLPKFIFFAGILVKDFKLNIFSFVKTYYTAPTFCFHFVTDWWNLCRLAPVYRLVVRKALWIFLLIWRGRQEDILTEWSITK